MESKITFIATPAPPGSPDGAGEPMCAFFVRSQPTTASCRDD